MAGHIIAPPMPMSARQASSHHASVANPPRTEKKAKTPAPATNSVRRP